MAKHNDPQQSEISMTLTLSQEAADVITERLADLVGKAVQEALAASSHSGGTVVKPDCGDAMSRRCGASPTESGVDLPPGTEGKATGAREAIRHAAVERQALIDSKQLAKMLGISDKTFWSLKEGRSVPAPIHFGRAIRWREVEILAWLDEGCPSGEKWRSIRKKVVRDYEMSRRQIPEK